MVKLRSNKKRLSDNQKKVINLDDIGEVCLFKSNRAKRINITVKLFEGVKVSVPKKSSFKKAEKFVLENKKWIYKNLQRAGNLKKDITIFDEHSKFYTRRHQLEIIKKKAGKISVKHLPGKIYIEYPTKYEADNPEVQNAVRSGIEMALRAEAKEFLPNRTAELAQKHGFTYNKVFLKNAKTRWGSCSGLNNINLNIHLMRLPDYLVDYLILHELCHTQEKNHSDRFWKLLEKILGSNARQIDKELKKYKSHIY
jgi:predicted metal-dependent hydrolase